MNVQAAKASIDTYFASEASEMYVLIIAGVGLAILAGLFFPCSVALFFSGFCGRAVGIGLTSCGYRHRAFGQRQGQSCSA
ncbi:hypothetical protein HIMB100_00012510 [SAR116 cluster alpha proteobacterium HIMB100]|nr:hypothetical protein HIMB100_00012510 [SAR116 cluster alpha proteobacterium HIMB100]